MHCIALDKHWDTPSGHAVCDFPSSVISMLLIFVGFTKFSINNPRNIAGWDSLVDLLPMSVDSTEPLKKTTDSVSRIESEFFAFFGAIVALGRVVVWE